MNFFKSKFELVLIFTLSLLCLAIPPEVQAYVLLPWPLVTGTNTVPIGGTNAAPSKVLAAATSIFNLPSVAPNTNYFPAVEFVPGAVGTGARFISIQANFAADASSTANIALRFAASNDRVNWVTNALVWWVPFVASEAMTSVKTNLDTGVTPYWCLTGIDNTNATANATNFTCNVAVSPVH